MLVSSFNRGIRQVPGVYSDYVLRHGLCAGDWFGTRVRNVESGQLAGAALPTHLVQRGRNFGGSTSRRGSCCAGSPTGSPVSVVASHLKPMAASEQFSVTGALLAQSQPEIEPKIEPQPRDRTQSLLANESDPQQIPKHPAFNAKKLNWIPHFERPCCRD